MTENNNILSLNDWAVESIRVTLFSRDAIPANQNWWHEVAGTPAEKRIHQPKLALIHDEGTFGSGTLVLNIQNDRRVDWRYAAAVQLENKFPTLGTFPDAIAFFMEKISPWLANINFSVQRIAFGVVLLHQVSDKKAGYQKLLSFLPNIKIDSENISDFFYQINRPRISAANLKINRLAKWSVAMMRMTVIEIPSDSHVNNPENHACRLELDINTDQNSLEIPSDRKDKILLELIELGKEIAVKGDIS